MLRRQSERKKRGDTSIKEETVSLVDVIKKRKQTKRTVSAQDTIPYRELRRDGIIIGDGFSSKSIVIMPSKENKKGSLSSSLASSIKLQRDNSVLNYTVVNRKVGKKRLVTTAYGEEKGDNLDACRKIVDKEITSKMFQGTSTITSDEYVTLSVKGQEKKEILELSALSEEVLKDLRDNGLTSTILNGEDRIKVIGSILNMGSNFKYNVEWNSMRKRGISTKDYVSPSSFNFINNFTAEINGRFTSVVTLVPIRSNLNEEQLSKLAYRNCEQILNISIRKLNLKDTKELIIAKEAKEFIDDVYKEKDTLVSVCITVRLIADTIEELNSLVCELEEEVQDYGFRALRLSGELDRGIFEGACIGASLVESNCAYKLSEVKKIIPTGNTDNFFISGVYMGYDIKSMKPIARTDNDGELILLRSCQDDIIDRRLATKHYIMESLLDNKNIITISKKGVMGNTLSLISKENVDLSNESLMLNIFDCLDVNSLVSILSSMVNYIYTQDSKIPLIDNTVMFDIVSTVMSSENPSMQTFIEEITKSKNEKISWVGKTLLLKLGKNIKSFSTFGETNISLQSKSNTSITLSSSINTSYNVERLMWLYYLASDYNVGSNTVVYLIDFTPMVANEALRIESIKLVSMLLAKGVTVVLDTAQISVEDGISSGRLWEMCSSMEIDYKSLIESTEIQSNMGITKETLSSIEGKKENISILSDKKSYTIMKDELLETAEFKTLVRDY